MRFKVSFCQLNGYLRVTFKGGTTKWWMAVQPYDFIGKITSVQNRHAVSLTIPTPHQYLIFLKNNGNVWTNMNFGEIEGFWFKDEPKVAPVEIKITVEDLAGNVTTYTKLFQESEIVENVEYLL